MKQLLMSCVLLSALSLGAERLSAATSSDPEPTNAELLKEVKALAAKVNQLENKLAKYENQETVPPAGRRLRKTERMAESQASASDSVASNSDASSSAKTPLFGLGYRGNPARGVGSQSAESDSASSSDVTPTVKTPLFGLGYRSNAVLNIGAYGELKFGSQEAPGGWKDGFDAGRIVLLPTFQVTESIIFNAEIEFEHGGIADDEDDKLTGSVDIEQAYIDFKFNEHFNWRAPGVDVVPFGFINLFHEPTQFYSVQRPELDNGLIPTTWFEGSTSIYGKVVDNLNYQFQINTGLEDIGQNGGVPDGEYEAGISGEEALALARTPIGDFNQTKNAPGFALRLSYTPPFVPGLAGSTSVFYTSNVTPRGAHADAETGQPLGHSSVTMVDTEVRYRIPRTGFEFRGEFVDVFLGTPANLRANNDGNPENNVGDHMWGYSLELAYHFDLSKTFRNGWEIVPFYRYTYENLQTGGFSGTDENFPTGQGKRQFHTLGIAAFPTPQVVLKLDYQFALDDAPNSPRADHFLGGVGFFF